LVQRFTPSGFLKNEIGKEFCAKGTLDNGEIQLSIIGFITPGLPTHHENRVPSFFSFLQNAFYCNKRVLPLNESFDF